MVSLVLFITACIGIQIIAFLATARGDEYLNGVRILSKSTADYSLDEILRLAPILPGILEDLEQDQILTTPEEERIRNPAGNWADRSYQNDNGGGDDAASG